MLLTILSIALLVFVSAGNGASLPAKIDGRIAEGYEVTIEEFPYQAGLIYDGERLDCGGAIVSPTIIITAAHCITEKVPYAVQVGSSIARVEGHSESIKISEMKKHPSYGLIQYYYEFDVAILKLEKPLQFGPTIQPIQLAPENSTLEPGTMAVISGWGTTTSGQLSNKLLAASIPILDRSVCEAKYPGYSDSIICAGNAGKDACNGDSGGPLVIGSTLYGVVSFGSPQCGGLSPGAYTNVSKFRPWIDQTVADFNRCRIKKRF